MEQHEWDRMQRDREQREREQHQAAKDKAQKEFWADITGSSEAAQRRKLEEKRDRVESLRREGYSEAEIRVLEKKRGSGSFVFKLLIVLSLIAGALYIFRNQLDSQLSQKSIAPSNPVLEPGTDDSSEEPKRYEEVAPAISAQPDVTADQESEAPIEFVSEPVIQPIPSDGNAEPTEGTTDAGDQLPQ